MVTNGGYGAVNHALSLGVPLVIAGDSEEKPEIAARVAWAGAGINLGTGRPSASQIREAVRTVLTKPQYRQRAWCAPHSPLNARDEIAKLVEDLAAAGRRRTRAQRPFADSGLSGLSALARRAARLSTWTPVRYLRCRERFDPSRRFNGLLRTHCGKPALDPTLAVRFGCHAAPPSASKEGNGVKSRR
jgi:hypothetical protein